MLGVSTATLSRYGAVSDQTARAMAEGALTHSHAQIALAIRHRWPQWWHAGKAGRHRLFAWAAKKRDTHSRKHVFTGDRETVRKQAVVTALQGLLDFLS
jgi:nicotinamide-nucleotide amidase